MSNLLCTICYQKIKIIGVPASTRKSVHKQVNKRNFARNKKTPVNRITNIYTFVRLSHYAPKFAGVHFRSTDNDERRLLTSRNTTQNTFPYCLLSA